MRRAAPWIALAAVAAAVGFFLLPRTPSASPPLRPPPAVPAPTLERKIEYFHGLLRSGTAIELAAPLESGATLEIPLWRDIAGPALLAFGQPALDFLTSPDRYPEYVSTPDLLVAVLQLLPDVQPFPGLYPFLSHWLDEASCPQRVPGSDWPDEIRNLVFLVLKAHPLPEAEAACAAEFSRPRRDRDLRPVAADILLRLGKADVLNEVYRTLPPNEETPEPDLRTQILDRLFQMAAAGAGDRNRGQVAALEPLLEEALQSPRKIEKLNAMGVLHRLGRPGMDAELRRYFEENRKGDETAAWSALLLLVADGPVDFVREACLRRVENPDGASGFISSVQLLAMLWPADIAPRLFEWIRAGKYVDPYMSLPRMLRHDRAAVVAWLRDEVREGAVPRLTRALSFISGERVTELAPDMLAKVREVEPARRPALYAALAKLKAPGTEALLLAELRGSITPQLKSAAVTELLNLRGDAGTNRLAELLAEGDAATLDALLQHARRRGAEGVPDAIVPAALEALRSMPGEDARRAALLVLRFRGRLDDVREGLVQAYRYEPSRRVAREIGETIDELAHR